MTLVQGIFNEKCKIRNGDKQKIGRRGSGQTAIYYVECASCLFRGVAQPGSAPALGAGSRRFKSSRPDHHNRIVFIVVCEWNHKMALVPRYASVFRVPRYASLLRYLHNLVILFAVNLLPSISTQKN